MESVKVSDDEAGFVFNITPGKHRVTSEKVEKTIYIGSMYGIFAYIYHKNQPKCKVNIPYMDYHGMGNRG